MNRLCQIILTLLLLSLYGCSICSGCSRSGKRTTVKIGPRKIVEEKKPIEEEPKTIEEQKTTEPEEPIDEPKEKVIVKMEKVNGVYQIPIEINGVSLYFIFDTGASLISISDMETALLYKQGKLTDEDIVGQAKFTDANGDVSEGTIINLKTVKIGNRTLENVEASVVHNLRAPLLLGQSALESFGKISIDYQKGEIIFE